MPSASNRVTNLVLIDTCVFVDFFRINAPINDQLRVLLSDNRVLLSPFVRLELLFGLRKKDQFAVADLLDSLQPLQLPPEFYGVAETLMPLARTSGISVGLIDFFLAVQALGERCALFTRDKPLLKLARTLGIQVEW